MSHIDNEYDVIIIGAGLAGLRAALEFQKNNVSFCIVEKESSVGGRVRTIREDGYIFDRGFQVLLTGYEEAKACFDYEELDLGSFASGARIYSSKDSYRLTNPLKAPLDSLATLGELTVQDIYAGSKLLKRMFLRRALIGESTGRDTRKELLDLGFSHKITKEFFEPFLSGVYLDPSLRRDSDFFYYLMRTFAFSSAVLPSDGMQALPEQLAAQLPKESIRLASVVERLDESNVYLLDGEVLRARDILIATDVGGAQKLLPKQYLSTEHFSTTTFYFSTQENLELGRYLCLTPHARLLNNFCSISTIAPSYAPQGQILLSASVVSPESVLPESDDDAIKSVTGELAEVLKLGSEALHYMRKDTIQNALPVNCGNNLQLPEFISICGDYCMEPSINGALKSGRLAANALVYKQGRK